MFHCFGPHNIQLRYCQKNLRVGECQKGIYLYTFWGFSRGPPDPVNIFYDFNSLKIHGTPDLVWSQAISPY